MSGQDPGPQDAGALPSRPEPPGPFAGATTPNAERFVLEADAMRRRQLRSALLHGSRRTWREHRRVWPGVVLGVILVAVVVAAMAVVDAYQKSQEDSLPRVPPAVSTVRLTAAADGRYVRPRVEVVTRGDRAEGDLTGPVGVAEVRGRGRAPSA